MSQMQNFLRELTKESATTRKMLSIVPNDKYDWRPHPKSMTIRDLATHLADIASWFELVLHTTELDFAATPYQPVPINNTNELLAYFEESLAKGQKALETARDESLADIWILRNGDQILTNDNKYDTLRMCMGQIIHHRAQLGVYLRLLNIPIPGSYGPSADELEAMQKSQ